ncbi:unnamed protein product [Mytilus coruscus]|uniref:C-type lectin domain-containing protein n=1 Tax=Mytilus coruscus TaxID=42192 RepID=A0A6J8DIF5_MYTCO|nr:unnamed protein product [Mytilus coruscus]
MVQMKDSLKRFTSDSLICCLNACLDSDECVTFFHNEKNKECVMHSKTFIYSQPNTAEEGWKFYVNRDVTGRCPYPYLYYRRLDFCYSTSINTINRINFNNIKSICSETGGRLAAVESHMKEQFLLKQLADRPHLRIAIDGLKTGANTWTLEDGSKLTYFNWGPGEPQGGNQLCLELYEDNKIFDCPCSFSSPGVFLCEK